MVRLLNRYWPLLIILFSSFALRIIKLEELFYFTYDESVFAFVARRLLLWNHLPLIGGVTPFGVHVAPYFYWFFSITLIIGNLNPLFWGYFSAALAIGTSLLIYLVGTKIDSRKVGFIASVIWSFSYLANLYDRHFWGLTFGPLFSLIIIYCLYQIIKGKEKFVFALAVVLSLIIHADLSFYLFLLMAIVSWIVFRIPVKKSTFVALAIIVLSFLPLVVFDLRHNFANTKPLMSFLKSGKNTPSFSTEKAIDNALLFPRTFARFVFVSGDQEVSKQYSYCRVYAEEKLQKVPTVLVVLASLVLIAFVCLTLKRKWGIGWKLVFLQVLLYFLGIQIYGSILRADIFEHYLSGIFALLVLVAAKSLSLTRKNVLLIIMATFLIVNIYKVSQAKNDLGLKVKRQAIEYTMQKVQDKPFSLDSLSTCWKLSGYRYLFSVFGREPVKSYVDPNFAYLYGTTSVWDRHPQTVVAFVAHDFVEETNEFYKRYALLKANEIESATFGILEVIIMDNSTDWFDKPQE